MCTDLKELYHLETSTQDAMLVLDVAIEKITFYYPQNLQMFKHNKHQKVSGEWREAIS